MKATLQVVSDLHRRVFDIQLLKPIGQKNSYMVIEYENLEFMCEGKLCEFIVEWLVKFKDFDKNMFRDIIIYNSDNNTSIKLIRCYPVNIECGLKHNSRNIVEIGFEQLIKI